MKRWDFWYHERLEHLQNLDTIRKQLQNVQTLAKACVVFCMRAGPSVPRLCSQALETDTIKIWSYQMPENIKIEADVQGKWTGCHHKLEKMIVSK